MTVTVRVADEVCVLQEVGTATVSVEVGAVIVVVLVLKKVTEWVQVTAHGYWLLALLAALAARA